MVVTKKRFCMNCIICLCKSQVTWMQSLSRKRGRADWGGFSMISTSQSDASAKLTADLFCLVLCLPVPCVPLSFHASSSLVPVCVCAEKKNHLNGRLSHWTGVQFWGTRSQWIAMRTETRGLPFRGKRRWASVSPSFSFLSSPSITAMTSEHHRPCARLCISSLFLPCSPHAACYGNDGTIIDIDAFAATAGTSLSPSSTACSPHASLCTRSRNSHLSRGFYFPSNDSLE